MEQHVRHYFAYGLNLRLEQIKPKCSYLRPLGAARLSGHSLGFFGYSSIWDGAQETLVPDEQQDVWGVVYEMTDYNWSSLDSFEDAREDGTGAYFHYPVEVLLDGKMVEATIYKKALQGKPELPSKEYLEQIVAGAKEQGLPEAYISLLMQRETKPASYPVPKKPTHNKVCAISADCGDCSSCSV